MTDQVKQVDILSDTSINRLITKRVTISLLILGLLLGFLNVFLTTVGIPDSATLLDPNLGSKQKIMTTTSIPILVVIPIASFVLSLFLSLIPFRNNKYSEKFIPFGLFTMTILQFVLTILLLSDLIKK